MTPPRRPTVPGGVPTLEPEMTPTPVLVEEARPTSRSFVAVLSTVLGIVLGTVGVLGFAGKYFFVDRAEYTQDRGASQAVLLRVEMTMQQQATILDRQEKAFDRLSETVRALELGRGRR